VVFFSRSAYWPNDNPELRKGGLLTQTREALFEEVVRSHSGLISRIALSHEANSAHREDLTQEILLAIWRALPSFRGQSSLKTYIASIAQKRAISHVARHSRMPRTQEVSEHWVAVGTLPDEAAIAVDLRQKVLAALRLLSIAQRETALLMLEGFSFVEIGETLGISANAAMLRCQRAKIALAEVMHG